jgi:hypothetical protein
LQQRSRGIAAWSGQYPSCRTRGDERRHWKTRRLNSCFTFTRHADFVLSYSTILGIGKFIAFKKLPTSPKGPEIPRNPWSIAPSFHVTLILYWSIMYSVVLGIRKSKVPRKLLGNDSLWISDFLPEHDIVLGIRNSAVSRNFRAAFP